MRLTFLAVLLAALTLTACSGGAKKPIAGSAVPAASADGATTDNTATSAATTSAATTGEATTGDESPCALLTAADAAQLTHAPITSAVVEQIVCHYRSDSGTDMLTVLVETGYGSEPPQQVMDELTVNGTYEQVTGIGDAAVYAPADQFGGPSLYFVVGGTGHITLVQLSIETTVPGVSREMTEAVAKAIVPKIT